jgi:uncharacterized protein YjaG (DUF416 family)
MLDFSDSALKRELTSISRNRQLAFALLLCERMMPDLDRFSIDTGFDGAIYRKFLDEAWLHLAGIGSLSSFDEVAKECLDRAPDTEEFDHPLTSAALNASLSVAALMGFLSDFDVTHIAEIAGLARDTPALYAQSIEANRPRSLGFTKIMEHPLVQKELRRQAEDLTFLKFLPTDVAEEIVPLIKARAGRPPTLPISEN